MKYYFNKIVNMDFESAVQRVTSELKNEGFGILTEIDVQQKMKEKLNKDFRRYTILGACNPSFAFEALQVEDKIGTMLPCNIIVQEKSSNETEVAAIDPIASMKAIENPDLIEVAEQVRTKLQTVINRL